MAKARASVVGKPSRLLNEVLISGENASPNEAVRELWDEGQASGLADPNETMDDLKAEARKRRLGRTVS